MTFAFALHFLACRRSLGGVAWVVNMVRPRPIYSPVHHPLGSFFSPDLLPRFLPAFRLHVPSPAFRHLS